MKIKNLFIILVCIGQAKETQFRCNFKAHIFFFNLPESVDAIIDSGRVHMILIEIH